jgi:hypothetical protein
LPLPDPQTIRLWIQWFDWTVTRRLIFAAFGVLAIGVLLMIWSVVSSAKTMAQYEKTQSDVSTLALFAEIYKADYGKYPPSFVELASRLKGDDKIRFAQALPGRTTGFLYEPLSNGFTVVTRGFRFDYLVRSEGNDLIVGKFSTNEVHFRFK